MIILKYKYSFDLNQINLLTQKQIKTKINALNTTSIKKIRYFSKQYSYRVAFGKYYESALWRYIRAHLIIYAQKTDQIKYLGYGKYICPMCKKQITWKQVTPHHLKYKLKGLINNPTHDTFSYMCYGCHQKTHKG